VKGRLKGRLGCGDLGVAMTEGHLCCSKLGIAMRGLLCGDLNVTMIKGHLSGDLDITTEGQIGCGYLGH
jgi:hypothetical protein